ncbi:GAF domain-containing sensor histidine kinase [Candidatus Microgenomates bacterium]|nr:GAF domain-containing sensor histidine kinase [Candidatus Microgenomates bacterium]
MKKNALTKLNRAAVRFLVPLTPEETYKIIVQEVIGLMGARYGSLLLPKGGELERVYSSADFLYKLKIRKRGLTYRAFKNRQLTTVKTPKMFKLHPLLKKMAVKSTILSPVSYRNQSVGVLTLSFLEKRTFNQEELGLLKLFGSMASLAIIKVQLYDEAQQALENHNLFLSMASHELRTPLTAITGYTDLLRKKLLKTTLKTERRWSELLYWESIRLNQLLNELLQVQRIRIGKLQYFWTEKSIKEVLQRVLASFHFVYPQRRVFFEDRLKSEREYIVCDFDKLIQVFTNLLDNAAKFSSPDSPINVVLSQNKHYYIISVKDQGQGITQKDLDKVFIGFYKGTKDSEGMGLGLFLVQNIIHEHRGLIKIKSKVNQGTTVEVRLASL